MCKVRSTATHVPVTMGLIRHSVDGAVGRTAQVLPYRNIFLVIPAVKDGSIRNAGCSRAPDAADP